MVKGSHAPWFGYFAETYMAPPNEMAYGDEVDHLEASVAGETLGELQSVPPESAEFLQRLRRYRDVADTRSVKPSLTTMTADKDDPRFDEFYVAGNEARYFLALFLTDMPSYSGLNFECRDPHYTPAPNEHYSKLYVFHETDGPKAVSGPFQFGRNGYLFFRISRIRRFAERVLPRWRGAPVRWLLPPDATGGTPIVAWRIIAEDSAPQPVCVVNTAGTTRRTNVHIPLSAETEPAAAALVFSTNEQRVARSEDSDGRWEILPEDEALTVSVDSGRSATVVIDQLLPGEAVIIAVRVR